MAKKRKFPREKVSSKNAEASNRQLLIILGLFVAFIVGLIAGALFLVDVLISHLPVSVEQQLGRVVVPIYEQQAQPSDTQTTLNQLVDQLETHLPADSDLNRDFQVLYVPDETVNAIAIPGDRIIIYRGLLEDVESENELMMILGHELGHFAHRDHLRGVGRGLVIRVILANILPGARSLESFAVAVSGARFSQSQERQADEFGLDLLEANYGHVGGATDFFRRLSQQRNLQVDFLSTHPSSKNRVRYLKRLIQKENYPVQAVSPLPESLENPAVKG
ncbi:MAG: M48 family metallopeptidase [Microcoleaceae cyanobacterium]